MPKELSASQSEFFKDSRIRSKDGRLLVMYHGSDSNFDEFSTPLAWFSTNRRYASEYGSHIYACYLDCKRPFICGDTSLPLLDSKMSADDIDAGFMQAFSLGDDIDDIDFEDDVPLADSRSRVPVPSAAAEALRAKAKIGKAEFDAIVKDVMSQYSDPDADPSGLELRLDALTRSTEFKDALAARGYDSIVAREEGHLCVAAFRPESIKLVSNANPTRSRKIDEGKNACKAVCGSKGSRTVKQSNEGSKSLIRPSRGQNGLAEASEGPSNGRPLSKGHEDFFRNSKIRDGDGNLLVCYHGTEHLGFGSFDSRRGSSQFGRYKFRDANVNYFTTSEDVAAGYTDMGVREGGNVYACYLNVENPYVLDAKGQGFNGLVDDGLWMVRIDILDRIASEAWTDGELGRLNELLSYLTVHLEPTGRKDSDGNAVYDLHRDTNGFSRGVVMRAYTLDELLLDEDAFAELRGEVLGSQDDYYLTTDDVINAVLYMNDYKGEDYDGVVFDNIADKGPRGMLFGADATDIATLKSANQIKRISNLNPTGADGLDEDAPNAEPPSGRYGVVNCVGIRKAIADAVGLGVQGEKGEALRLEIAKRLKHHPRILATEGFVSDLAHELDSGRLSNLKASSSVLGKLVGSVNSYKKGDSKFNVEKSTKSASSKVSDVPIQGSNGRLAITELRLGNHSTNFRVLMSHVGRMVVFLSFFYEDDSGIDSSVKSTAETRLKEVVEINGKDAIMVPSKAGKGK